MSGIDSSAIPNLQQLIRLFHDSPDALGRFQEVTAEQLPPAYRRLLAHEHHMTVTMEDFHGSLVLLEVIREQHAGHHYGREILLRRLSDRQPVQFGIVRIDWRMLPEAVRRPIADHEAPLGRILIEHQVLRQVRLSALWALRPSDWLARQLELDLVDSPLYGRTALILCDGEPAIELLEIAAAD